MTPMQSEDLYTAYCYMRAAIGHLQCSVTDAWNRRSHLSDYMVTKDLTRLWLSEAART